MYMEYDGVPIFILPDSARCEADQEKRCPLDIDECPCGHEKCSGDCYYYTE